MPDETCDPEEMMIVTAARLLRNDDVVFIGVGPPSKATLLARRTHAPNITLIYESGTLDTRPTSLPPSIGDGELSRTARAVVSVPEMFNYWLQGGRIRTGFLAAAQIDRFANFCSRTFVMIRQNPRTFVEKVDFITSAGYLDGVDSRDALRVSGRGPEAVITDLGLLEPSAESRELTLTRIHPGVTVEAALQATGWPLKVSEVLSETEPPTSEELAILRSLDASVTGH
jgi:glutaconate CoA-transferase subunit B